MAAGPSPRRRARSTRSVVLTVTSALVVLVVGAVAVGWAAVALVKHDNGSTSSSSSSAPAPPPPITDRADAVVPTRPDALLPAEAAVALVRRGRPVRDPDRAARLRPPRRAHHPPGRPARAGAGALPPRRSARRRPGRPGVPATQYAAAGSSAFGTTVARYFDLVGMDPRGVGESTPLQCLDTQQEDAFLDTDPSPDTPAEVAQVDASIRKLGDACLAHDRGLTEHMSTVEAAKDMDILRAALGEPKLDYHGASYGTLARRDVRQPLPHARRQDGARRRDRPRAEQRAALAGAGTRLPDRARRVRRRLPGQRLLPAGHRQAGRLGPDQQAAAPGRPAPDADRYRPSTHRGPGDGRHRVPAVRAAALAEPACRAPAGDRAGQRQPAAGPGRHLQRPRTEQLQRQQHQCAVRRELPRPRRLRAEQPGAALPARVREGGAHLRALVRLRALCLLDVAGAQRPAHGRAAREGCAADRRDRHHP